MKKNTVLICDDNIAIHRSLTTCLKSEGIEAVSVYDGESALQALSKQKFDVVVLDVMLPGANGYEVCREIRKFSNVHIIMLSARGEEMDRIIGLEIGADDYVSKPFSPREVVIRIKKVLKRLHPKQGEKVLALAELTIHPESYEVFIRGEKIDMTPKEISILTFMVSNAGKVLTRERILGVAWGYEYYGDTRVVDTLISRLRQKLSRNDVHFVIRSVYGIGYKIEETV